MLRWGSDVFHLAHPRRIRPLARNAESPDAARNAIHASGPPDTRFMRPGRHRLCSGGKRHFSPAALLDAYGRGLILRWIFGRATWWAPAQRIGGDPRLVSEPAGALALAGNRVISALRWTGSLRPL